LGSGCHPHKGIVSDEEIMPPSINRVAVVGFQSAMSAGEIPDVVRSPLSGGTFMAEPVPDVVAQDMTGILFDRLVADKRYELVSPGQAKGVIANIVSSDQKTGLDPIKIWQEVGEKFGADAVMVGYIFRWREREGSDYAVNRPASVAFDLHLVRPADGAILWRGKFDKSQQALSENLLDADTFFQGGGRWMTAEKLAMIGLKKLLADMPKPTGKGEGS
jgi:hypothetical protein